MIRKTRANFAVMKVNKMLSCLRHRNEDALRSRQLDKQSQAIHRQFETAVKILLLGTAESGKTTIIKQMKILHINGFTEEERREKIQEIYTNIHETIYELVTNIKMLGIEYQSISSVKSAKYFLETIGKNVPEIFSEEYKDHVLTLWDDANVQACLNRSNEFQLLESTKYFLDKFQMIANKNYIPSTEDILHSRKVTTGIHQIKFSIKVPKNMGGGMQEFRMFDVGGQRDQRNKWIQVFEGIQAVLFLISCADFDQFLKEEPTQNKLSEAVSLFSGVWHNRFLVYAGIIVFLNKQDLMEQKVRSGKSIGKYFSDYEEYRNAAKEGNFFDECDRTRQFIKQKLVNITKQPRRRPSPLTDNYVNRECFYHFTIATDTNNIKKVFQDVHDMILADNLANLGLM